MHVLHITHRNSVSMRVSAVTHCAGLPRARSVTSPQQRTSCTQHASASRLSPLFAAITAQVYCAPPTARSVTSLEFAVFECMMQPQRASQRHRPPAQARRGVLQQQVLHSQELCSQSRVAHLGPAVKRREARHAVVVHRQRAADARVGVACARGARLAPSQQRALLHCQLPNWPI